MRGSLRRSLTLRLTALFATISVSVLLLLGLVVGRLVEQHFEELDTDLLTGNLHHLEHLLGEVRTPADLDKLPERMKDLQFGHHGLAMIILGPAGRTLFASGTAQFPDRALLARNPDPEDALTWSTSQGAQFRGIFSDLTTGIPNGEPIRVGIATNTAHHQRFMASFHFTLWTIVGVAALATGLLGWIAVRRELEPLQAIRQKAAAITADHLDHRLSTAAIPSELTGVVEALNDMLARLESSFQRLSAFSSDLAHELRTPVSNLLTQTQVMLSKTRTVEEYCDVLASNEEEFERLSRMIADMLFLAKADNDQIVPNRETIHLEHEVEQLVEFYEALCDEKHISLSVSGAASLSGDRLMLRRAISNLLSNAIRHTPEGGKIDVAITSGDNRPVRLSVTNTGPTIPANELPKLFDRFYRADPARHRSSEGAGLGLAITLSIVQAHGGTASASSTDGVTCFALELPK